MDDPEPSAVPTTASFDYPIEPKIVAERYAPDDAERLDAVALAWSLVFYGAWLGLVAGWWGPGPFALLGVVAYVRNFNALHESFHAPRPRDRAWLGRHLMVVTSPLMLGYGPLRENHRLHHTWAGQAGRDPDHYLASGHVAAALLHALTQPEQSFVRYVARRGLSATVVRTLAVHAAIFAGIATLGWGAPLLWWVVVTRIGNTASWFIFDWCLHHPRRWGTNEAPGLPRIVRAAWIVLFSRSNLYGVEHHHIHHHYPSVRDADLPRLCRELRACG